jgi:hypothetical protein
MNWAQKYLVKRALLSQDEIDEIAGELPRFRRRKMKDGVKRSSARKSVLPSRGTK